MADTEVSVKRWGDSLAVIIPRHIAKQENINVNDTIHIRIDKETDVSDIFGIAGKMRSSPQEFKDESRKGWR